jgi:hypothetical protein
MRVDFSSSDQCCSVFRATVYWSSIFILPKEVCKVIDQILRSFLWHGAVGISKAAKVAWDVVYLPRDNSSKRWGMKRDRLERRASVNEIAYIEGCWMTDTLVNTTWRDG